MTTRAGGVGSGRFESFNLREGLGDDPACVAENRARLVAACGARPVWLDQVHGTCVVRLSERDAVDRAGPPTADASLTTVPGIACAVQVADCLPVLFAADASAGSGVGPIGIATLVGSVGSVGSNGNGNGARGAGVRSAGVTSVSDGHVGAGVPTNTTTGFPANPAPPVRTTTVAAAHAGWRGLAAGVLEATLAAVCEAGGCTPAAVRVWLGPSIGPRRFEVGADVLAAFNARREFGVNASADAPGPPRFVPHAPGKWLANLPLLARDRLQAAGVRDISGGAWCTVEDASRFFSFRRDGTTGRMAALVWIEPGG